MWSCRLGARGCWPSAVRRARRRIARRRAARASGRLQKRRRGNRRPSVSLCVADSFCLCPCVYVAVRSQSVCERLSCSCVHMCVLHSVCLSLSFWCFPAHLLRSCSDPCLPVRCSFDRLCVLVCLGAALALTAFWNSRHTQFPAQKFPASSTHSTAHKRTQAHTLTQFALRRQRFRARRQQNYKASWPS